MVPDPGSGVVTTVSTRRSRTPMSQEDHDRQIDYIEFETTDIAQSKNFYTAVFGWKFTDWG